MCFKKQKTSKKDSNNIQVQAKKQRDSRDDELEKMFARDEGKLSTKLRLSPVLSEKRKKPTKFRKLSSVDENEKRNLSQDDELNDDQTGS